jgi:hypothetical protein
MIYCAILEHITVCRDMSTTHEPGSLVTVERFLNLGVVDEIEYLASQTHALVRNSLKRPSSDPQ